jgi:hypothetical protein
MGWPFHFFLKSFPIITGYVRVVSERESCVGMHADNDFGVGYTIDVPILPC